MRIRIPYEFFGPASTKNQSWARDNFFVSRQRQQHDNTTTYLGFRDKQQIFGSRSRDNVFRDIDNYILATTDSQHL